MLRIGLLSAILLSCACAGAPRRAALDAPADAARRQAVRDVAWSIRYYLGRHELDANLAERVELRAIPDPGGDPTTRELVAWVEKAYTADADEKDRAALSEAADRTLKYFGSPETRLWEPVHTGHAGEANLREGWPAGLAAAKDLPMEDAAGYADARLGALGSYARAAARAGLLLAAAPGPAASWPPGCRPLTPVLLNFPGTTHGFRARAASCQEGGSALVLDGFANRSLFIHETALLRVLLEPSAGKVRVYHGADTATQPRDDLLLDPFRAEGIPRTFDALALGYYEELLDLFRPEAGPERTGEGWRAFQAQVGTTTLVAVAVEESWFGETLGASVARLLQEGVSFKTVYFAGSAGALSFRPPYSLAHPSCYLSPQNDRIDLPNELSGETPGPCHIAVASPLIETRAFLRQAAHTAETIDVEGFALARAAEAAGLRLGTAYLITDYPDPPPALRSHRLSETRGARRLEGARAYAGLLRKRLEYGTRAYRHPIEDALQSSLEAASDRTRSESSRRLGPLSPEESSLYRRVAASVPPVIFRTWPRRLVYIVRDGLALSPRRVDDLKNSDASAGSRTPTGEDALYGARDYLFAGIGQNDREELYGPLRVFLSTEAWRHSFATRASGARTLALHGLDPAGVPAGEPLERARADFFGGALVPADYSEGLAAAAVEGYRMLAETRGSFPARERMRRAAAADDALLWRMLAEDTDAYLEGKIPWSFPAEAMTCIETDDDSRAELTLQLSATQLARLSLRRPGACLAGPDER